MRTRTRIVGRSLVLVATIAVNIALFTAPLQADDPLGSCWQNVETGECICSTEVTLPYCDGATGLTCEDIFTELCE